MQDSQTLIRTAYDLAAANDIPGWVNAFTQDGTFTDMSTGVTYRGETLGDLVEIYATAFSDMHRELYRVYTSISATASLAHRMLTERNSGQRPSSTSFRSAVACSSGMVARSR